MRLSDEKWSFNGVLILSYVFSFVRLWLWYWSKHWWKGFCNSSYTHWKKCRQQTCL